MSSISSLMTQTSTYENFVQQLVAIESQPKLRMQIQKSEDNQRKSALGEVSSSISKFISQVEELENPLNKSFQPMATSVSDNSVVAVNSASGITRPSDYNITVKRLATNDTALGQVTTAEGFGLAAQGAGSISITIGDQTEDISIATTKDDGSGGTVDMTNREILESLATEIENRFGDAAGANVFQVDADNVQFSIKSLETGFDNRIQIDSATGAMSQISDSITHLVPETELNASFIIDGVTFQRSTNTVDDAIEGLSFTLKKATGTQEQMSVNRDLEMATSNIKDFISAFNNVNKTIRDRTFLDAENNRRGALQDMRAIRNLTLNLRQTALLPVDSIASGQLARLSEIGIAFKKDGTMYIDDEDALNEMLSTRPDEVANLFTDPGSAIAKMKASAESYTESNGIISSLESGLDQKIERLDRRIAAEDRYLEKYEERQRAIFNKLDLMLEQGQAQFNQVANFVSGF